MSGNAALLQQRTGATATRGQHKSSTTQTTSAVITSTNRRSNIRSGSVPANSRTSNVQPRRVAKRVVRPAEMSSPSGIITSSDAANVYSTDGEGRLTGSSSCRGCTQDKEVDGITGATAGGGRALFVNGGMNLKNDESSRTAADGDDSKGVDVATSPLSSAAVGVMCDLLVVGDVPDTDGLPKNSCIRNSIDGYNITAKPVLELSREVEVSLWSASQATTNDTNSSICVIDSTATKAAVQSRGDYSSRQQQQRVGYGNEHTTSADRSDVTPAVRDDSNAVVGSRAALDSVLKVLDSFVSKFEAHADMTRTAIDSNSRKIDKLLDAVNRTTDIVNTLTNTSLYSMNTAISNRSNNNMMLHSSPNSDHQRKMARKRRLSANLEHTGGITDGLGIGPDSAPPATLNTNDIHLGSSGLYSIKGASKFPYPYFSTTAAGGVSNFTPCSFALTDSLCFSDTGTEAPLHLLHADPPTGGGLFAVADSGCTPVRISRNHNKSSNHYAYNQGSAPPHTAVTGVGYDDSSRLGMFWNSNLMSKSGAMLPSIPSDRVAERSDAAVAITENSSTAAAESNNRCASPSVGCTYATTKPSGAQDIDTDDEDACSDVCGEIIGAKLNMLHYEGLIGAVATASDRGEHTTALDCTSTEENTNSSKRTLTTTGAVWDKVHSKLLEECNEQLTGLFTDASFSQRRDVSESELLRALEASAKIASCSLNAAAAENIAAELRSRTEVLFTEKAPDMQRFGCLIEEILSSLDLRQLVDVQLDEKQNNARHLAAADGQTTPTPRRPTPRPPAAAASHDATAADFKDTAVSTTQAVVPVSCRSSDHTRSTTDYSSLPFDMSSYDSMIPRPSPSFIEKEVDETATNWAIGERWRSQPVVDDDPLTSSGVTAVLEEDHVVVNVYESQNDGVVRSDAEDYHQSSRGSRTEGCPEGDVMDTAVEYSEDLLPEELALSQSAPFISPLATAVQATYSAGEQVEADSLLDSFYNNNNNSELSSIDLHTKNSIYNEEEQQTEHDPATTKYKWTPVASTGVLQLPLPRLSSMRDFIAPNMALGLSTGSFRSVQSPESPFNMIDTAYRDSRLKAPRSPQSGEGFLAVSSDKKESPLGSGGYIGRGPTSSASGRDTGGDAPFPSLKSLESRISINGDDDGGGGGGDGSPRSPRSHTSSPLFIDYKVNKNEFMCGLDGDRCDGTTPTAAEECENTTPN
eukprot:Lankesteria_metandrocarpae@DN9215_c0_g1_i1.p1